MLKENTFNDGTSGTVNGGAWEVAESKLGLHRVDLPVVGPTTVSRVALLTTRPMVYRKKVEYGCSVPGVTAVWMVQDAGHRS